MLKKHNIIAVLLVAIMFLTCIFSGCAQASPMNSNNDGTISYPREKSPDNTTTHPAEEPTMPPADEPITPSADEPIMLPAEEPTMPPAEEPTMPPEDDALTHAAAFEAKQYDFSSGSIKYWLYTPSNVAEDMPLIVYLHGGSGKGDNLDLITSADGLPQYLRDGKLTPNAYVIMPQVSSEYRGWSDNKADVMKLISFVSEKYNIDENRISLTGHSMGGSGAWMLALAYPNTFSAVAPLSGSVKLVDANITKLKNMPVWAIIGTEDKIVDPQSSIDFITELSKVSDSAKLTELEGADHFAVPNLSYLSDEFNLIEWLLTQTK